MLQDLFGGYDEASDVAEQAVSIDLSINDLFSAAAAYDSLGNARLGQEAYEHARQAFCEAVDIPDTSEVSRVELRSLIAGL